MRGTILFTVGPGLSARRMCSVKPSAPPLVGMMASRNTSTPMPPIQWLKLRQNSSACPSASTSERMEAPVVVKPDTISKSASM